jgi:hypothetical protein
MTVRNVDFRPKPLFCGISRGSGTPSVVTTTSRHDPIASVPPSCAGRFDRRKGDLGLCTPYVRKVCKTPVPAPIQVKLPKRATCKGWEEGRQTWLNSSPMFLPRYDSLNSGLGQPARGPTAELLAMIVVSPILGLRSMSRSGTECRPHHDKSGWSPSPALDGPRPREANREDRSTFPSGEEGLFLRSPSRLYSPLLEDPQLPRPSSSWVLE